VLSLLIVPSFRSPFYLPQGTKTDEYRIGFSLNVLTMEDAKSEIGKIFQEAWEKEQGEYWEDMGPPIVKTQISLL